LSGSRIAVVVVNFGSHELLERNFAPLDGADVVVVDNFSSAAERTAVRASSQRHGWQLVEMAGNDGFGAGVNAGVRAALARGVTAFLLLNPDAVIDLLTLERLGEAVHRQPMSVLSPRVNNPDGTPYFAGYSFLMSSGRIRRSDGTVAVPADAVPWISGACMAFSDQVFDRTGGFRDAYFLYWEDIDFSVRAAEAGAELRVERDLIAVHDEGGTQGRTGRAKSATYYRYNCRNRLLFAAQHLPTRSLVRWILLTPRESWQVLLRGGRRQLLHSPRPLIATVRGSLEGLGLALAELLRRSRPTRT